MPRNTSHPRLLTLAAAVSCALAAPGLYAQDVSGEKLALASESRLNDDAALLEKGASIVSAEVIEGSPQTELVLSGNAEVRHAGSVVKADRITYTQATGEVAAEGNALVARKGSSVKAPKLTYQLDNETGEAQNAEYEYAPRRLRAEAGCIRLKTDDITELTDVLLTTCPKGDDSWWITMNEVSLDEYAQQGTGTGAVLHLGGIPVLGTPWFSFPMTQERKSGLLTPTLGMSSSRGLDLSLPYYFNIAPNYDLTLTPRVMSKRGVGLGSEVRFKQRFIEGTLAGEYMPQDRERDEKRWGITADVRGAWQGFTYGVNYNRVSDKDYPDDFAGGIRSATEDLLAQDYWLTYSGSWWNAALRVNQHQALEILAYDRPYERVPQLTWNAYLSDAAGFELTTTLDATRFKHVLGNRWYNNNDVEHFSDGDRFVVSQKIAYPLQGAGWFIKPQAELIGTWYSLDTPYSREFGETSISRTVPVFSVDSGLIFEKNMSLFGRDTVQTLEPRLFYAYIPERDQSEIPLFDTDVIDTGFAQLFNANEYAGWDRVGETNQVSAAVTTRFIDSETGLEWFKAGLGQRYYFNDQRTAIDGTRIRMDDSKGDLLATVGARLTRNINASAYAQYSYDRSKLERANAGVRWQPKPMSVMGLYYRYNRASYNDLLAGRYNRIQYNHDGYDEDKYIRQVDFSMQWPLSERWYILTRQNYSFDHGKFIESLVGFEHRADCWTVRAVAQRYTSGNDSRETNFYLQLELTGLGSIGSSPLEALTRGIRGYQTQSPIPSTVGTYDYYQ